MYVSDYVCIITGLEYKFMVKSVDPDGTTSAAEKKNVPEDVVASPNREDGMEEEMEEEEYGEKVGEMTSPAPVVLEDKGILPNRTGNNNNFNITHRHQ